MSRSTALAAGGGRRADRLAQAAQRLLRVAADARLALGLLLVAGAWPDAELARLSRRLADATRAEVP